MKTIIILTLCLCFCIPVGLDAATSEMRNTLTYTGEGSTNPAYGNQIKNIMIYQAGGWGGLATAEDQGNLNPTWSLHWGKAGYLVKTNDVYLWQMHEVQAMSKYMAIAVLLMPDIEAIAGNYGSYWEGVWKKPTALFASVRWAAWMKGVQVAPLFSINNYECLADPNRGQYILPKLQTFVTWYKTMLDALTLRTVDGKIVILVEGLPHTTGLSSTQRTAILTWMEQQQDILWIDNLAQRDDFSSFATGYGNIYRSAAVAPPYPNPINDAYNSYDSEGYWCPPYGVQDYLKNQYGAYYLWHFVARYGKFEQTINEPKYRVCESTRLKWLNISPHTAGRYPVIISQWNEYSEFLVYEPTELEGYAYFDYLSWRLSQQP